MSWDSSPLLKFDYIFSKYKVWKTKSVIKLIPSESPSKLDKNTVETLHRMSLHSISHLYLMQQIHRNWQKLISKVNLYVIL